MTLGDWFFRALTAITVAGVIAIGGAMGFRYGVRAGAAACGQAIP